MFQFLADWWDKIAEFFISVFDFIISIPAQVITWVVEFFQWFYKTMFNLVVNFAFDTIESVSTQFNPDFTLDRNLLLEYLAKINCWLPVDLAFTYGLILLQTWLAVKIFILARDIALMWLFPAKILR